MKKIHILIALLGLVGTSCSNQELETGYIGSEEVMVSADFALSRVSFSETDNVTYANWENGDGITLNTPTQGNLNYTATVTETAVTFAAQGENLKDIAGETVYACYPAAVITDGVVALPATNKWADTNKPLPFAYAMSSIVDSKVKLAFEHTFAFLKLTLPAKALENVTTSDGNKTVHKLLVKSASDSLAVVSGTFKFEDKTINVTEKSGEIELTLTEAFNPAEETERSFYIPILPQAGEVEMTISVVQSIEADATLLEIKKQTPTDGLVAGHVYKMEIKGNSSAVIEGESAEIYLAEAGTLSQYITDENKYTIKSLKISGYLNGSDIKLLRDMAGCDYDVWINSQTTTGGQLANLDMSEANIVEGGTSYIEYHEGYSNTPYYTQDNYWGDYFFMGCGSLVSVKIPHKVTDIGPRAFYNCTYLTDVEMPIGLLNIGKNAFGYCKSITTIDIPEGVTDISNVFHDCTSLTSIEIPNRVTNISGAFSGCSSLTSIEIPDGVIEMTRAFSGCSSLTSITIPNGVTDISYAFQNCSSLNNIVIPNNVTIIKYAFQSCSSLTSITIPNGVTDISCAFNNCSSLTSIDIPDSVTDLGSSTFSMCTSLTSIEIPAGVNKIGTGVFEECTSLTDIYIPDGVNEIPRNAFYKCSSLKSIRIPDGITNVGDYAFGLCSSLTELYCYSTVPPKTGSWGVFDDISSSKAKLYVPQGCVDAYKESNSWNYHFTIVEMSE